MFHASDAAIVAPADEAAIRTAFENAYDWSAPAATVLGAVENGPSLSAALALLKKRDPQIARTAMITVRAVTFTDASHASVTYSLSYLFVIFLALITDHVGQLLGWVVA